MKLRKYASLLLVLGVLIFWQTLCGLHAVPSLLLPAPSELFQAFSDTFPEILWHTAATFSRTLAGMILGSTLGLIIGLGMATNATICSLLDPIVESMRPVPAIAAVPFFILWFGTGNAGQILLICLSCATVLAVDVYHAVSNISPLYIRAAQSLGANRWMIYRTVILPAILPALMPGLRIVSALAYTVAIGSEFMGAQWGLGFVIMRARRTLETQTILLGLLFVGFLARATDIAIRSVVARMTTWSETSTKVLQTRNERQKSL